jgi:aminoglycoside 6'-N-acetyltransferase I
MKVRKLTKTDRPKWLELRRALWPDCPAARHALEMEQWQRSGGVVLLAESPGGQAVGFAEVSIRQDHVEGTSSTPVPYLEGWYVVPGHRRKGVGRALVKGAEDWALEAGYSELASDVEGENHEAIQAHRGLGFREVGRSVHFVRPLCPPNPCVVLNRGRSPPVGEPKVTDGPSSVS